MSLIALNALPELCKGLETFENGLNLMGYIPILGSGTALLGRKTLAVAEIISSLALAIFAAGCTITGNPTLLPVGSIALRIGAHGLLNLTRALFELPPGLSLITCLPYDLASSFYFGGRIFTYIA